MITVLLVAAATGAAIWVVEVYALGHVRRRRARRLLVAGEPSRAADVDGVPPSLDAALATIEDLAGRVTLAESFHRRLNVIVSLLLAVIGVLALVIAAVLGIVLVLRADLEQRDADRVERAVAACNQDNVTADRIDAGNKAKVALADALATLQLEIDGIVGPLVANPTTPQGQATADRYHAGQAAVEAALAEARAKIADADVPARDCTPAGIDRFLSTTTTTTEHR